MKTNALKASTIIASALTFLWNGQTLLARSGKEYFACFCVTEGMMELTGLNWGEARNSEEVKPIHARIIRYIDGKESVGEYLEQVNGHYASDEEKQAFRKKMLEDIKAEYEKKEALEEQIRILEAVKVMRSGTDHFHNFVCWNIDTVLNEGDTVEGNKIKADIDRYIDGHYTVRTMMEERDGKEYSNSDPLVLAARMEMVDTLIARYKEELEAA